jgi:hypothetical protein
MLIAFWIVDGLAAIIFLAAGVLKLARPKDKLASSGLAWVEDFSTGPIKLIGLAEVLGAIGLVLPVALRIAEIVTPIAAIALAVLMVGAVFTHARRKETLVVPIVLVLLAVASAILGFVVVK